MSSWSVLAALARWREALALYAQINDSYSIGHTYLRLASLALTPEEAAEHRDAARQAWVSIDRLDLIDEFLGRTA